MACWKPERSPRSTEFKPLLVSPVFDAFVLQWVYALILRTRCRHSTACQEECVRVGQVRVAVLFGTILHTLAIQNDR